MRRIPASLSAIALTGGLLVALSPVSATIPPTPESLASISASGSGTLIIGSDGLPYGVGANTSGQLTGTGNRTELTVMQGLPPGVKAKAVSAGAQHSVVVGSDGVPYATGSNTNGAITGTDPANRNTLSPMTGLPPGVTAVQAHASRWALNTLIIGSDGIPYVVGSNPFDKLGGSFTTLTPMPGWPSGVKAVDGEITYGDAFFVGDDGNLYARGYNPNWQGPGPLGVGSNVLVPMFLPSGVKATAVEASDGSTFIIGDDGLAYGIGDNAGGEITYGNDVSSFHEVGTNVDQSSRLPGGTHVVEIAAGTEHAVLLASNGKIYGTGQSSWGQKPNADGTLSRFELQELGGSLAGDVSALVAGDYTTFVADHDGIVYGSGRNTSGEIGGPSGSYSALHVVAGQVITNISAPKISGAAQFTKTLTAIPGTWSPSAKEYEYQWKQDGASIAGATNTTYVLTTGDIGKKITVTVTAKRGRLGDGTASSVETAKVIVAPALAYTGTKPKLKGTLKSGKTLSITRTATQMRADFNPDAVTLSYRWYRNGVMITGATKSTYKLGKKDKGKKIAARIYGGKPYYFTGSYLTAAVKIKK